VFAVDLGRPLRADARRNRALLLEAARAVFQRDGLAAQMDAIATEAGLGVGTLYRHFPTREALIAVLIHERMELAPHAAADDLIQQRRARQVALGSVASWRTLRMGVPSHGLITPLGTATQIFSPLRRYLSAMAGRAAHP